MLIAVVILLILWQLWLKHYFISGKEMKAWDEIFKRYF
jgi:hypothetical protein